MHKIETHLHTTYISRCGWLGAQALIKMYARLGYSAICVTDHYNRTCFDYADIDLRQPGSKTEDFLLGYRRMVREAEKYGIRIYEGAELRFDGSDNDYLLYGFHHDLLADPEKVISEGLEVFSRRCREDGALLIQAHPYRKGCHPVDPRLIEGVEVYNANPRHDSRNELAKEFAQTYGLLETAGSDCHQPGDQGRAGILAEELPEDGFGFAELLRSRKYSLYIHEEQE